MKKFTLVLRILIAIILFQTLFFKFSGSPESIYIFSKLGMEPWGRIASGVLELVAGVLLLIPSLYLYGALMSCLIISGAIIGHLTLLGIVVLDDGGLLFILALIVFFGSLTILFLNRKESREIWKFLSKKNGSLS